MLSGVVQNTIEEADSAAGPDHPAPDSGSIQGNTGHASRCQLCCEILSKVPLYAAIMTMVPQDTLKAYVVEKYDIDLTRFDNYFYFYRFLHVAVLQVTHYLFTLYSLGKIKGIDNGRFYFSVLRRVFFILFFPLLATLVPLACTSQIDIYYPLLALNSFLFVIFPQSIFQYFVKHSKYLLVFYFALVHTLSEPCYSFLFFSCNLPLDNTTIISLSKICSQLTGFAFGCVLEGVNPKELDLQKDLRTNIKELGVSWPYLAKYVFLNCLIGLPFEALRLFLEKNYLQPNQHIHLFYFERIYMFIEPALICVNLLYLDRLNLPGSLGSQSLRPSSIKLSKYLIAAFLVAMPSLLFLRIPPVVYDALNPHYNATAVISDGQDRSAITNPVYIYFALYCISKGLNRILTSFYYSKELKFKSCDLPILIAPGLVSLLTSIIFYFSFSLHSLPLDDYFSALFFKLLIDNLVYFIHANYLATDLVDWCGNKITPLYNKLNECCLKLKESCDGDDSAQNGRGDYGAI